MLTHLFTLQSLLLRGYYSWRASNYTAFWGLTLDEGIRYRLGTFRPVAPVNKMTSMRVFAEDELPEMFDARVEWPGLIEDVLDQGNCASSWAFSTTGQCLLAPYSYNDIRNTEHRGAYLAARLAASRRTDTLGLPLPVSTVTTAAVFCICSDLLLFGSVCSDGQKLTYSG